MRMSQRAVATVLFAAVCASASSADGLIPGSVLIYPIQRTGAQGSNMEELPTGAVANTGPYISVLAVTNTNLVPATPINGLGGSTNVHWEYVNAVQNPIPELSRFPLDCTISNRVEFLTPGDTRVVLADCHNGASPSEGYLVITAEDPNSFNTPWSHNYLVGSELVINGMNIFYHVNAIPFEAKAAEGMPTDADFDGQLDFDDIEYEPTPDHLILDFFVDSLGSSITLINLSGGTAFTAAVAFDVFNDNERPLSATLSFKCWMEDYLSNVGLVFTQGFLAANTQHDPAEFDIDCNGTGDYETGWARIRGLTNSSAVESYANPALLGAHSKNMVTAGGRRMWESVEKQTNGDFLKTGTDDPEN